METLFLSTAAILKSSQSKCFISKHRKLVKNHFLILSTIFFQVMHSESQPGRQYIIDIDVANGGIPYADSFYVNVHFYLSR